MGKETVSNHAPHVLLVNPWIHDFAAYDFWAKPYGLLSLAAILREQDVNVAYMDCLDRFHPRMPKSDPSARHGRGPYLKRAIEAPGGLASIRRTYSRYGILPEWLGADLDALPSPPDLILVTSVMTYWYPGVAETIELLKARFPNVPLVLGGIYARLCTSHARACSGADEVDADDGRSIFDVIFRHTGFSIDRQLDMGRLDALPYPAFDLQHRIGFVPLLTIHGCPFDCAYCASRFLTPEMHRRSPEGVVEEIGYWQDRYGVADFVFYDDALLVDTGHHAKIILESVVRSGRSLRFHTPNAVHIREIDAETSHLMFRAGFHTLRLGLETTAFESRGPLDHKVTASEFYRAIKHLKRAGFNAGQIGAYLLVGLPGQSVASVEQSIHVVKSAGITPVLAHYTPIPHTRLWEQAVAHSQYDLAADPIYCNNAIFPCQGEEFSWQTLSRLKRLIRT